MKVACFLTDSIYAFSISNRGGIGMDILGSKFVGTGEIARGDGIGGAGSEGRGGVLDIVDGTKSPGVSRTVVGMEVVVGTSFGCALPALLVLALDPGACLSLDSVDS